MQEPNQSLREHLSALQTVLADSHVGKRGQLFDSRERLRAVTDAVSTGPAADVAPICVLAQRVLDQVLRQGALDEVQSLDLLRELLAYVDGAVQASESAAAPEHSVPRIVHDRQETARMARESAARGYTGAMAPGRAGADQGHVQLNSDLVDETRVGEILLQMGVIDADSLTRALSLQQVCRRRLGDVLVTMGVIDELGLREALERQRYATLRMAKGQGPVTPGGLELRIARQDLVEGQRKASSPEGAAPTGEGWPKVG